MILPKYWSPMKKLMVLGAMAGGKAVEDTATGNPVTFLTDLAKPLKSLVANFLPVQASGTPSPENVLPITGWDAVNVYHGADQTDYDTYPVTFPYTVLGGYVDLISGEVWATWAGIKKKWSEGDSATDMGNGITRKVYPMVDNLQTGNANNKCNIAPYSANESAEIHFYYSGSGSTNRKARVFLPTETDGDTQIEIITKLSVPTLITTLTPQQINAIKGNNTLWSDCNSNLEVTFLKKG